MDHLKWVVEPASGDAEVGFMWRHMVDAVMFTRQDDAQILEDGDVAGETKIRV